MDAGWPMPNFKGCLADAVMALLSNYIPHKTMGVIAYPCPIFSERMLGKWALGDWVGFGILIQLPCLNIGLLPKSLLFMIVNKIKLHYRTPNSWAWHVNDILFLYLYIHPLNSGYYRSFGVNTETSIITNSWRTDQLHHKPTNVRKIQVSLK